MKTAVTVCEYNPLHNGHLKHIEYIKKNIAPDCLAVIMSGNFVQRGEGAVADKYTRANWAIKAGADIVIELPTVFALGNAEVFASGAVKLMDDLNMPLTFCFGAENGDKESFIRNADIFLSESKEMKTAIKARLSEGLSLARARYEAAKAVAPDGFDQTLFENPNNILGLEYTKAVRRLNAKVEIMPMKRENIHSDDTLYKEMTSASSIRRALGKVKISQLKTVMPSYVLKDLDGAPIRLDKGIMTAILNTPAEVMKTVPDCSEGLENRIKCLAKENLDYSVALNKITTKRYTESRIRRIAVCNMLGISEDLVEKALLSKLYFKVLSANEKGLSFIAEAKNYTDVPFLTRKTDVGKLAKTAALCFEKDALAVKIYALFSEKPQNEYYTSIVTKTEEPEKKKRTKAEKIKKKATLKEPPKSSESIESEDIANNAEIEKAEPKEEFLPNASEEKDRETLSETANTTVSEKPKNGVLKSAGTAAKKLSGKLTKIFIKEKKDSKEKKED